MGAIGACLSFGNPHIVHSSWQGEQWVDPEAEWKMGHLLRLRTQVLSALEEARKDKYEGSHDTAHSWLMNLVQTLAAVAGGGRVPVAPG